MDTTNLEIHVQFQRTTPTDKLPTRRVYADVMELEPNAVTVDVIDGRDRRIGTALVQFATTTGSDRDE
jgi:hypothetical protein